MRHSERAQRDQQITAEELAALVSSVHVGIQAVAGAFNRRKMVHGEKGARLSCMHAAGEARPGLT